MPVHFRKGFVSYFTLNFFVVDKWGIASPFSLVALNSVSSTFHSRFFFFALHKIVCWGWGCKIIFVFFICVYVIQDIRFDVSFNIKPGIWFELFYLPFVVLGFCFCFFFFICWINMERSSFYIFHLFGVRLKCLKVWVFRLRRARGIFFAVCSHFLVGGGRGMKRDNWFCGVVCMQINVRNCKSPGHELQTQTVHKFKMCSRFRICVF